MRAIKFRAKYRKQWHYVTLKELCEFIGVSEYAASDTPAEYFSEGKYKTQYTGLKDENGKEIYEGDIIKFKETRIFSEVVKEVYFDNGEVLCKSKTSKHPLSWYGRTDRVAEVIGNIYENPELLEEKSDEINAEV